MEQPLLSIAIPTLNRIQYIKSTIFAFLEQIEPYGNQIEFIILNNASDDGTAEWLEDNFADSDSLKYINYSERVDIVSSITRCINSVNGYYVWIFGDDDLPMPFAIDVIMKILLNRKYSILHFNSIRADSSFEKYINIYGVDLEGGPVELSHELLISEFNIQLGLIITLVFKKNDWNQGLEFYKNTYTGYGFLAPIIAGSKNSLCYYYPFPITVHRIGTQRYMNRWPDYILVGFPSMLYDLNIYGFISNKALLNWQKKFSYINLVKTLLIAKAFRYKIDNIFWSQAAKYQMNTFRSITINCIRYFMPTSIAKVIFYFGSKIKNINEP